MNKIILYVGIAILLGTVTMVAPLALLGPEDHIPDDNQLLNIPGEHTITGPESTEADVAPEVPQEVELTLKTTETPADLSPIGLMAIPSFLVAMGVFVFFRKRMS